MKRDETARLLDPGSGAPDLLRAALGAARDDGPTSVQLARLAARLPLGGALPGGGHAAPPPNAPLAPPAAALPSTFSGALIGGLLGLAVVGGGAVWDAVRAPSPPASPSAGMAAAATAGVARGPAAGAEAAVPKAPAALPAPAIPAPPSAPAVPAAPPVAAAGPEAAPDPSSSPAPGDALGAGSPGGGGPGAAVEPESETRLLQRAQDELGRAPARALDLAAEHERRFPGAVLAQEREVIAVQALLRLGRSGEARARVAAFEARYPSSAHRRRLESLLR